MADHMDCAICLESVNAKSDRVETTCNHVFHPKCAWKWYCVQKGHTCAMCRQAYTETTVARIREAREGRIREIAAEMNRLAIELDSMM